MAKLVIDATRIGTAAAALGMSTEQGWAWFQANKDCIVKVQQYVSAHGGAMDYDIEANADSAPIQPAMLDQILTLLEAIGRAGTLDLS